MSEAIAPTTTAWVNASAGVAGDMLLAALVDLGADRVAVMDAWASLGLDGYAATFERVERAGVAATWLNLCVHDPAEHRPNGGRRHHSHRPARDVLDLIANADLPAKVRADSSRVYRSLASIEGAIHGVDPADVELHEVGAVDSILDIVGVCAALDSLGVDELTYSPIGIGVGIVSTAHGRVPHPAPATARLLEVANAAVAGIATDLETATPTGVALLTTLGAGTEAAPAMNIEAVGLGAGTADPADRANVVQILVGRRTNSTTSTDGTFGSHESLGNEVVHEISTNVDDATAETVAYTIERLMSVGALDAWATPITMKKFRPGTQISCLASTRDTGTIRDVLLAETGSLGARVRPVGRWPVERTTVTVTVDGHQIAVKVAAGRRKVEYADAAAAAAATGRPLRDIMAEAERRSHTDP